jgi:pilus assembly protein Flp/PilA
VTTRRSRLTATPRHGRLVAGRRAGQGEGMQALRAFWKEDEGQGMIEYALVIVLIALVLILTQVFFADKIKNFFSNVGNNLT